MDRQLLSLKPASRPSRCHTRKRVSGVSQTRSPAAFVPMSPLSVSHTSERILDMNFLETLCSKQ